MKIGNIRSEIDTLVGIYWAYFQSNPRLSNYHQIEPNHRKLDYRTSKLISISILDHFGALTLENWYFIWIVSFFNVKLWRPIQTWLKRDSSVTQKTIGTVDLFHFLHSINITGILCDKNHSASFKVDLVSKISVQLNYFPNFIIWPWSTIDGPEWPWLTFHRFPISKYDSQYQFRCIINKLRIIRSFT